MCARRGGRSRLKRDVAARANEPRGPTESEVWSDRYLREHGYEPGKPEPEFGVERRPDRLIEERAYNRPWWRLHRLAGRIARVPS
jgi:hypothetical protein